MAPTDRQVSATMSAWAKRNKALRSFSRDRELASAAGKKGNAIRWAGHVKKGRSEAINPGQRPGAQEPETDRL